MGKCVGMTWVVGMAVLLCGCLQTRMDVTLNPDGSGKMAVEAVYKPEEFKFDGTEPGSEAEMRAAVRDTLEKSTGVDTWGDISFRRNDDGWICFHGTAYFRKVSAVRLAFRDQRVPMLIADFAQAPEGGMRLDVQVGGADGDEEEDADEDPPTKLTEAEIARRVRKLRAKLQQAQLLSTAFMSEMWEETTFRLPGTLGESTNLRRTEDGRLRIRLVFADGVDAINGLMADDRWVRQYVLLTASAPGADEELLWDLMEELFGERDWVRAHVTGDLKPLFDYDAEVAEAKQEYPNLLKKLEVVAPPTPGFAPGKPFRSLRVAAAQLVSVSNETQELEPFNEDVGYTLVLLGRFQGRVLKVENITLRKAVTDTGANLIPEDEYDRRIDTITLSKDKTAVLFEVPMTVPGAGVRALQEISGTLEYLTGEGVRDVDLGVVELSDGARATQFGAEVDSVKKCIWDKNRYDLSLELHIPPETVHSIALQDGQGKAIPISGQEIRGYTDTATVCCSHAGPFPKTARIVVRVYGKLNRFRIPFQIHNISLVGVPLK